MNAIHIAAKIDGDTVTMERGEFERLIEMLEDAQDLVSTDATQRKLAAGVEETVSSAFLDRMLAGESLVRLWREHRGMTTDALAERTGLSAADLAELEQGRREASIGDLKEIAKALGVGLDDLVR